MRRIPTLLMTIGLVAAACSGDDPTGSGGSPDDPGRRDQAVLEVVEQDEIARTVASALQGALEIAHLFGKGAPRSSTRAASCFLGARKLLPEVRGDLEAMVEGDVARAQVYQLLGDIDMQQDQLDSALEMYRLARQSLTER